MSKPKKALLIYLVVSSVILHIVAVYAIFTFGPAMKQGYEMGQEFAKASAGHASNVGVVKDVCTLQQDDSTYIGYAVDFKGQTLYVMGTNDGIKKGDEVAVTVTKHPYAPLKTLVILVSKNGP
jgi:hypothetical protein